VQVAVVCIPAEHDAAPHAVPLGQSRQAPAWHLPSVPHVDGAVATQTPRGSVVPLVTLLHIPFVPPVSAAEQAWHAEVHAESQQNLSAQEPLAH
jgi:hypothetical protein